MSEALQEFSQNRTIRDCSSPDPSILDNSPLRYSREHIKVWLSNWHLLSSQAEHRFTWMEMKLDIEQAVNRISSPKVRAIFELYCIQGFTFNEVASRLKIKVDTVEFYYERLTKAVVSTLLDTQIHSYSSPERFPIPEGRYFGTEGRFDEPIGRCQI